MADEITVFSIKGLHGYLDLDIRLQNNRLILVGENGSGKTSVLRLFFYFLTGQWTFLHSFHFSTLRLCMENQCVELSRSEVESGLTRNDILTTRRLPLQIRERLRLTIQEVKTGKASPRYLETLAERYGIPVSILVTALNTDQEDLFTSTLREKLIQLDAFRRRLDAQVVYLPTYRRIEEELHLIVRDKHIEEAYEARRRPPFAGRPEDAIELIEFGMADVEAAIEGNLTSLKEFARTSLEKLTLGYLGDVVDHKYSSVDLDKITRADDATIDRVLGRISEHILSPRHKQSVQETVQKVKHDGTADAHDRVICHYLLKLLDFQEQLQERESSITQFQTVCNRYFGNERKRFVYDSSTFSFKIQGTHRGSSQAPEIKLQHLSSGEKQIVSLFSHLYLAGQRRFFVIIDEPELSLSVTWQRSFLVDVTATSRCAGLLAATHSPFIYENELDKHAHGLEEFLVAEGRQ